MCHAKAHIIEACLHLSTRIRRFWLRVCMGQPQQYGSQVPEILQKLHYLYMYIQLKCGGFIYVNCTETHGFNTWKMAKDVLAWGCKSTGTWGKSHWNALTETSEKQPKISSDFFTGIGSNFHRCNWYIHWKFRGTHCFSGVSLPTVPGFKQPSASS